MHRVGKQCDRCTGRDEQEMLARNFWEPGEGEAEERQPRARPDRPYGGGQYPSPERPCAFLEQLRQPKRETKSARYPTTLMAS